MLPRVNFPPDSVWAPATKEESGRARSVALAKSTGSSDPSRTVPVMVPVCCALEKSGTQKMLPASTDKRSEEHTSELQSLMRISYAVFCLKTKKKKQTHRYKDQR